MNWRAAFADQAESCAALGSPFTAGLLAQIAQRGLPEPELEARVADWDGDISSRGASVPLRVAGALHGLVLEGRAPALAALYPQPDRPVAASEDLWRAVTAALRDQRIWVAERMALPPQTNEVGRSAALIAAARWLGAGIDLPLVLSELGASAGLNLMFDRYALATDRGRNRPAEPVLTLAPDWRGGTPPGGGTPKVAARAGADLAPIDPVADRLRLLSYIWPDQFARMARIAAALDAAAVARPHVEQSDAVDWLETRLAIPQRGHLHLVYHTIAWQYFPKGTQARGEAILADAGARATPDAPLARFSVEADGQAPGAAMMLTLWPGGTRHALGRFDFHGRWIDWQAPDTPQLPEATT
jgi:hypothetical protein